MFMVFFTCVSKVIIWLDDCAASLERLPTVYSQFVSASKVEVLGEGSALLDLSKLSYGGQRPQQESNYNTVFRCVFAI